RRAVARGEEFVDGTRQCRGILRRDEDAVRAVDDLRQPADARGDHRPPEMECRERDAALRLNAVWREDDVRGGEVFCNFGVGDEAEFEADVRLVIPSVARDLGGWVARRLPGQVPRYARDDTQLARQSA